MAFGLKQTILFTIFCVVVSNVLAVPVGPPSDIPIGCPVGLREIQEDGSVKCRVVPPVITNPRLLEDIPVLGPLLFSLLGGLISDPLAILTIAGANGLDLSALPVSGILANIPLSSVLANLPVFG